MRYTVIKRLYYSINSNTLLILYIYSYISSGVIIKAVLITKFTLLSKKETRTLLSLLKSRICTQTIHNKPVSYIPQNI